VQAACRRWGVEPTGVEVREGKDYPGVKTAHMSYAQLAQSDDLATVLQQEAPPGVNVTPVKEWRVLGTSVPRINRRDLLTGAHRFPSDQRRPGMLYGKVLRPPSYGAKLVSVDLAPAKAMNDVVAVQDGQFVALLRPRPSMPVSPEGDRRHCPMGARPASSSREVFDYLRKKAQGGVPKNPFAEALAGAHKSLKQTYHVPYVQHAPMEPRVALAEWTDGKLTVWTGTQGPFGYHGELVRTFRLANDQVRVVVPDFGCGFGGKHTGEAAVEAARLARAANRPVILQWTREEEFTWAYFRPAAVIDIEAGLDDKGGLTSWHFININSGGAAVDTPYRIPQARSRFVHQKLRCGRAPTAPWRPRQ